MRVTSKTRWWMVERGGRYLLMSVLGDPKQLLEEPSSCPRQWEHVLSAPHPSTKEMIPSLVFSWRTIYLGKGFTAGGRAWGHFARGSQLVEQWILSQHSCCVRTPQEVTNLAFSMVAWLSLHLKTNQQSSPFWPCASQAFLSSWMVLLGTPSCAGWKTVVVFRVGTSQHAQTQHMDYSSWQSWHQGVTTHVAF